METSTADTACLCALAEYTRRSFRGTNPTPFGCDIRRTDDGTRLFRGLNAVGPECDPTAHAELRAVRRACKKLRSTSLRGHTLYTTCEPCPMCMGAILWSGLDRVVFGASIADAAKHCSQIHVPARKPFPRQERFSMRGFRPRSPRGNVTPCSLDPAMGRGDEKMAARADPLRVDPTHAMQL